MALTKPSKNKRVVIDIPEGEHRKLKVQVAQEGTSMAAWLRSKIKEKSKK